MRDETVEAVARRWVERACENDNETMLEAAARLIRAERRRAVDLVREHLAAHPGHRDLLGAAILGPRPRRKGKR